MHRSVSCWQPRTGCCTVHCSSGLLTGMRSGEICGLMAEDITAKGNLGRFVSIRPNAVRLLKSKAAEREVPLHGVLEKLLDTALPRAGRLFPYLTVDKVVKRYATCAASSRAAAAPCSTPLASGSSPSVSAQGFLSTSPQVSWGITPQGPPIS